MIKLKYKVLMPVMAVLTSIYVTACGGSGTIIADGGISGTGITMGRITNFGSIFVNGVRFDVDNAKFVRDGIISSGQADYSVGEFIVIKGSVEATGTVGIADEVSFTNEIEGSVTLPSADNKRIEILGQTVNTDQLTVFIGFNLLTDLIAGNIVEVSGVRDATGTIQATSIKLKVTSFVAGVSENEIKGTIENISLGAQTFMINNIIIEYANATVDGFNGSTPRNGQFVEVKSNSVIVGNTLIATKVELKDEYQSIEVGTEAKIEGQITRFVSTTDFDVNGLAVTTNTETEFKNGTAANIAMSAFLEVEGVVNASGVLVADSIEFKDTESNTELEGLIESINTSINQLVVSGQIIVINASTIMLDDSDLKVSPLTINDLSVGDKVEVKGTNLVDGTLVASKLEREDNQLVDNESSEETDAEDGEDNEGSEESDAEDEEDNEGSEETDAEDGEE